MKRCAGRTTAALLVLCATLAESAYAKAPAPSGKTVSSEAPVLFTADQIDYDQAHGFMIASGHVEVSQNDSVLLADTLTYDQNNNIVFAQGHVSVLESSGNVYFADEAELTDDMKTGAISQFKARLADNSLLAANQAVRKSESVTTMLKAVYSPCSVVCKDGTPKNPFWQISADNATLDREAQTITYRDAYMDFYGVPIIYTPYFSQPMPGADNKSGILMPEYRRNSNLGSIVTVPLYWAIGQDQDATLTPMFITEDSPVLFGQYRRRFDHSKMQLDGSLTEPRNVSNGVREEGGEVRGHFFGTGDFQVDDDSSVGFNIRRTTDDTYLRRYDVSYDALLTSRIYAETFQFADDPGSRSYAAAQALSFQGLRVEDNPHTSPFVFPLADMYYETAPMAWDSRFSLSGNMMSLTRDEGSNSRRLSMTGKWRVPFVTESGQLLNFATSLRADAYNVSNVPVAGQNFDGTTGRMIPQASLEWRYPLINRFSSANMIIEPIVQTIVAPSGGNPAKIPNEDSEVPEFTDTNLFSENRFAGYDRVETGARVNYGLRSQLYLANNASINALFGQAWRADSNPLFPITKEANSHFSDYVGMMGVTYMPLSVSYRFRLNKDNLSPDRNELNAVLAFSRFSLYANYLDLEGNPIIGDKQNLSAGTALRLDENWTIGVGGDRDMVRNAFIGTNAALTYQNECITVAARAGHDFTSDRDFRQGTTVKVQVFLKNLH